LQTKHTHRAVQHRERQAYAAEHASDVVAEGTSRASRADAPLAQADLSGFADEAADSNK